MAVFNFYGVVCQELADKLEVALSVADGQEVILKIDSPGGDAIAGGRIHRMLSEYKGETIAQVEGMAASAAGLVALGCDKLKVHATSLLMLHKAWGMCVGNSDEMLEIARSLEEFDGIQKSIVNAKLDDEEKVNDIFSRESWFNAKSCIEMFGAEMLEPVEKMKAHGKPGEIYAWVNPDSMPEEAKAWFKEAAEPEPEIKEEEPAPVPEPEPQPVMPDYAHVDELLEKAKKLGF